MAIGPLGESSSTRPCCARIPAGYAFAVSPLIRPMTRSSAFTNVAAAADTNSGLCTAAYGRLAGFGACARTTADPHSASAAIGWKRESLLIGSSFPDGERHRRDVLVPHHDELAAGVGHVGEAPRELLGGH